MYSNDWGGGVQLTGVGSPENGWTKGKNSVGQVPKWMKLQPFGIEIAGGKDKPGWGSEGVRTRLQKKK